MKRVALFSTTEVVILVSRVGLLMPSVMVRQSAKLEDLQFKLVVKLQTSMPIVPLS